MWYLIIQMIILKRTLLTSCLYFKNVIITRLVGTVALCVVIVSMENVAVTWTEVAQADATPGRLEDFVIKVKTNSNIQLFHIHIVIKKKHANSYY